MQWPVMDTNPIGVSKLYQSVEKPFKCKIKPKKTSKGTNNGRKYNIQLGFGSEKLFWVVIIDNERTSSGEKLLI